MLIYIMFGFGNL